MEIGEINIDFQVINSNDPALLLVADFSDWKHIENKPAIIEITLPGASTANSFTFVKHSTNPFNANNLHIGCGDCEGRADLPDGIYTICLSASPNTFFKKRYYLKVDRLRLELDKIYAGAGLDYDKDDKAQREATATIEFYLRVAAAHTRRGNIGKARQFFVEAEKLVRRSQKCTNCY